MTSATEQNAQAIAAHLRQQQHQISLLMGGGGVGYLPFGGGLFPGMNPAVVGGAPFDPTTLHAFMRARGMDIAGGRIPGLDAAPPSAADSPDVMAQMQQQLLASSGTVQEEQRSRQIQSNTAAALGGSGNNTEKSATPAATTDAKPDDAKSNKKLE